MELDLPARSSNWLGRTRSQTFQLNFLHSFTQQWSVSCQLPQEPAQRTVAKWPVLVSPPTPTLLSVAKIFLGLSFPVYKVEWLWGLREVRGFDRDPQSQEERAPDRWPSLQKHPCDECSPDLTRVQALYCLSKILVTQTEEPRHIWPSKLERDYAAVRIKYSA